MRRGQGQNGNAREPANPAFAGEAALAEPRSRQDVLQGLYKFRFTTQRGAGCGVMFIAPGGRLYGGDTGYSFIGTFTEADGIIAAEFRMSRHYYGPQYVPMFDVDDIAMNFTGTYQGEEVHFEGGSAALPGVRFTVILTAIHDIDAPPPGTVGPDGIDNGLYSIHIRMLDGVDPAITDEIGHAAGHIKGVLRVLDVKARWLGHRLHADIAVQVAPETSVAEADRLAGDLKHEMQDHIAALSVANVRVSSRPDAEAEAPGHPVPAPNPDRLRPGGG